MEGGAGGVGAGDEDEEHLGFDVGRGEGFVVSRAGFEEGLEEVGAAQFVALLDVLHSLGEDFVAELHEHADAGLVFRFGHEVFLPEPGGLDPARERVESS